VVLFIFVLLVISVRWFWFVCLTLLNSVLRVLIFVLCLSSIFFIYFKDR